jgi:hypothetical protein
MKPSRLALNLVTTLTELLRLLKTLDLRVNSSTKKEREAL